MRNFRHASWLLAFSVLASLALVAIGDSGRGLLAFATGFAMPVLLREYLRKAPTRHCPCSRCNQHRESSGKQESSYPAAAGNTLVR